MCKARVPLPFPLGSFVGRRDRRARRPGARRVTSALMLYPATGDEWEAMTHNLSQRDATQRKCETVCRGKRAAGNVTGHASRGRGSLGSGASVIRSASSLVLQEAGHCRTAQPIVLAHSYSDAECKPSLKSSGHDCARSVLVALHLPGVHPDATPSPSARASSVSASASGSRLACPRLPFPVRPHAVQSGALCAGADDAVASHSLCIACSRSLGSHESTTEWH